MGLREGGRRFRAGGGAGRSSAGEMAGSRLCFTGSDACCTVCSCQTCIGEAAQQRDNMQRDNVHSSSVAGMMRTLQGLYNNQGVSTTAHIDTCAHKGFAVCSKQPPAAPNGATATRPATHVHARITPCAWLWVCWLACCRTCDACVGHVRVHAITAVPGGARACAARNGLIVAHGGVTKREVVHAALMDTTSRGSKSMKSHKSSFSSAGARHQGKAFSTCEAAAVRQPVTRDFIRENEREQRRLSGCAPTCAMLLLLPHL